MRSTVPVGQQAIPLDSPEAVFQHECMVTKRHRQTFGPAGRDVGHYQAMHESYRRSHTTGTLSILVYILCVRLITSLANLTIRHPVYSEKRAFPLHTSRPSLPGTFAHRRER